MCSGRHLLRYPQLESMAAWAPHDKDQWSWMQMDFGEVTKMIGVVTRARRDEFQWVKDFRVTISNESDASLGYMTHVGAFLGNVDPLNEKINMFSAPVYARYVRIHPLSMFSYRSIRACIIIDSHTITSNQYILPNLLPPP